MRCVQDTVSCDRPTGQIAAAPRNSLDQTTQASETQVKVIGITPDHAGDFRSIIADSFPNFGTQVQWRAKQTLLDDDEAERDQFHSAAHDGCIRWILSGAGLTSSD